ncbi:MAG: hypothetical protein ACYDCC_15825 [Actinomycetota bacterium]
MFVYYYVHVTRPFEQVEPIMLKKLGSLPDLGEQAYEEGETLRMKVFSGDVKLSISKTVSIETGNPSRGNFETWIPIKWHATGPSQLFPWLEGDIIIGRVDDKLTQVAFRGTYQVPLGMLGKTINRIMLHRVAEAGVKGFIDRIAASLESTTLEDSNC